MNELNHRSFVSNIVLAYELKQIIDSKDNSFTENERRVLEISAEMLDGISRIPHVKISKVIKKGDNTYCKDCGKHARREKIIVRDTGKTKVKEGDRYCSRCGCLLDWEDSENEQ